MIDRLACSFLTALALASLGVAGGAEAQDAFPHTVEIWGGWGTWSGADAESYKPGAGTGVVALFNLGWPVQVGLDLAFSDFAQQLEGASDFDVSEFTASASVRHRWGTLGPAFPFLGARLGFSRTSADAEIETLGLLRLEQNGLLFGPALGVEVPMAGRVMLALSGEALHQWYGDASLFLDDVSIEDSGGAAWRYWIRLGLSWMWGTERVPFQSRRARAR